MEMLRHTFRLMRELFSAFNFSTSWTAAVWNSLVANIRALRALLSIRSCSHRGSSSAIFALHRVRKAKQIEKENAPHFFDRLFNFSQLLGDLIPFHNERTRTVRQVFHK